MSADLRFQPRPIAMQGGCDPPLPQDVSVFRVLCQSRVTCMYPIRGASSPSTYNPSLVHGRRLYAVNRNRDRIIGIGSSDRIGCGSTMPLLCGNRTKINDATSVGHGIGSTVPLLRVTGSCLSSLSIGHHATSQDIKVSEMYTRAYGMWVGGRDAIRGSIRMWVVRKVVSRVQGLRPLRCRD